MLILARHGETALNAEGVLQGSSDPDISPKGVKQADALANYLASVGVMALVSSPARRATTTAKIVSQALGTAPEQVPDIRERDFGPFEGLAREELLKARSEAGLDELDPTQNWEGCALVEQDAAIVSRVSNSLRPYDSLMRSETDHVVAVTHSGVIKALTHKLCFQSQAIHRTLKLKEGGLVRLVLEPSNTLALHGVLQSEDLAILNLRNERTE